MERADYSCVTTDIFPFLQGENRIRDGESGDECAYEGISYGFPARGGEDEGDGDHEYLACDGD